MTDYYVPIDYKNRINQPIELRMAMINYVTVNCGIEAYSLYNKLTSSERLQKIGITFQKMNKGVVPFFPHYCFRLEFPETSTLHRMSLSVPPDACGNRGIEYDEGFPSTYEMIPIDAKGRLQYPSEAGYDDIRRFFSAEEIVDELCRLAVYRGDINNTSLCSDDDDNNDDNKEG